MLGVDIETKEGLSLRERSDGRLEKGTGTTSRFYD